jgi:hypothetical protein
MYVEIMQTMCSIVSVARDLIEKSVNGLEKNTIVISGCGTSGRIAWSCARSFNLIIASFFPHLEQQIFRSVFHYFQSTHSFILTGLRYSMASLCLVCRYGLKIDCGIACLGMRRYLISGGDESLILSKELPEDDPHLVLQQRINHRFYSVIHCLDVQNMHTSFPPIFVLHQLVF